MDAGRYTFSAEVRSASTGQGPSDEQGSGLLGGVLRLSSFSPKDIRCVRLRKKKEDAVAGTTAR
jgi:hypothetical protein